MWDCLMPQQPEILNFVPPNNPIVKAHAHSQSGLCNLAFKIRNRINQKLEQKQTQLLCFYSPKRLTNFDIVNIKRVMVRGLRVV